MAFDCGNFSGLMLKRIQTVHIAHDGLDGGNQQRHPHRHREHFPHRRRIVAAQQMPRTRRPHKQRAAEERGNRHVNQAVREGGIKDNGQPVLRDHLAVLNTKALRRMHPAVRGQYPEGRHQRAEGDHAGGEEMESRANLVPAEQHHA